MTLDITRMNSARRPVQLLSVAAAGALLLSSCGDDDTAAAEGESQGAGGLEITDDHGTHTLPEDFSSVGAFDNRTFRTLDAMDVELSVAPRTLMQEQTHGYADDEDIADTGDHREPDLEQIVAADPELVITGQRYTEFYDDIAEYLADDAVLLEWSEKLSGENPEEFFDGLTEQTAALGEIFESEEVADELIADLDESMEHVDSAYDGESTVMGLLTSGGDINYAGPHSGRGVAPIFQEFDLEPALEVEDETTDHEGDDISVEAIADSDPDWIMVLDRDGMDPEDPEYTPAEELIADSPALQDVTAVQEDQIVYLPQNFYITEDIQAYTEFLNDFAEALESAD